MMRKVPQRIFQLNTNKDISLSPGSAEMSALKDVKREHMTRTRKEIQDAVALLKAMTVVVNMQGNQNLFGNALETIAAAIAEIHEEK